MKRRDFMKATGLLAGVCAAGSPRSGNGLMSLLLGPEAKPNIIFILADDLGIGNVSCYGADICKTPNIDRLAQHGTRFTHCYTAPLCGPSRALILTGRYAFRTGAVNQDMTGDMKPTVETFMPKLLKEAGYATASIGKWGQLPLAPSDFGFDEYLTFSGSGVYWNTQPKAKKYTVNGEKITFPDDLYMPDLMHTHVVNFITKNHDKPFYIYYSLSHVHAEILPTPDSTPNSPSLYLDNVAYMDKLVGKLVDELERQKLRERTLIFFVGDNGTGKAYSSQCTVNGRQLSGMKGSMLECGALVPCIANWPGTTPSGKVSEDMIDSTDFFPTFAELAGVELPAKTVIDGKSITSKLYGKRGPQREWIFIELGNKWYVRDAAWKLDQDGALYDMSNAPFEETLVAAQTKDPSAIAARKRLQAALDTLNPAGGYVDNGDGSGRHANKSKVKGKQREQDQPEE